MTSRHVTPRSAIRDERYRWLRDAVRLGDPATVDIECAQAPNLTHRLVVEFAGATISPLFCARCPATVPQLVPAIVVDAIDGVLPRGRRPHVGEKRGEVASPTVTHRYAAAAVPVVSGAARLVATRKHAGPDREFARLGLTVRRDDLGSEAAARLRAAGAKRTARYDGLAPALAATPPPGIAPRVATRTLDHRQSPELPPHHRNRFRHR